MTLTLQVGSRRIVYLPVVELTNATITVEMDLVGQATKGMEVVIKASTNPITYETEIER